MVLSLEEARQADQNGDVKKLEELKLARLQAKKEQKRLRAETKAVHRKRKAMLARTEKASTDDLLEALRIRMLRKRHKPTALESSNAELAPPADDIELAENEEGDDVE